MVGGPPQPAKAPHYPRQLRRLQRNRGAIFMAAAEPCAHIPQQPRLERTSGFKPGARGVEIDQQLDHIPVAPPLVVESAARDPCRTNPAQGFTLTRTDQPVEQFGLAYGREIRKALDPFARKAGRQFDVIGAAHNSGDEEVR